MTQPNCISTALGNLEIIRAQLSDGDTVIAILEEAAHWLFAKAIYKQWEPGSFIKHRQYIDQYIRNGQVYLAQLQDEGVGTFTLQWSDTETWGDMPDDAGYVHRLAVRRQCAGNDIGRRLLEWAEGMVASAGKRYLRLDCWSGNSVLCHYYERIGFIKRGQTNFGGGSWYATLFEKRVAHHDTQKEHGGRKMINSTEETRIERDSMGEMRVPADAYYGASTQRAVHNFPISDLRFPRQFIRALGQMKQVAALVNETLGIIDPQIAKAIVQATQEVIDGKLDNQFVLDIFQTGSGTSTNMNANEVIANRASELLGGSRGSRKVHPNDHVNFGQSSNDVIPTVIHLSALVSIEHDLIPALQGLQQALEQKAEEFMPIVKTGRTHLQDATPIRLGQEFQGYAGQIERSIARLRHAQSELSEVALGGTAVGTGVNTHPEFAARVCQQLSELNGVPIHETNNHFQAQSTLDNVVETSGVLNTLAVSLMKIANDIRWLGSGPRAGIGEIDLPTVQPGSSIMPGKVNPVIAESVCMVCAQVMGNHTTITVAGQSGNFEINVMMPVTAYNLLQSISLLAAAARNFAEQCIKGLQATTKGPEMVVRGLAICTALAPVIGYDAAADISKIAYRTGKTVREVAREKTTLSEAELDRILDPASMTKPSLEGGPAGG